MAATTAVGRSPDSRTHELVGGMKTWMAEELWFWSPIPPIARRNPLRPAAVERFSWASGRVFHSE